MQEIPKGFGDIAKYLQGPVMDEAFRRNLEAEEELDTIFDEQEAKYLKKIVEAEEREKEAKQNESRAKEREEKERRQKEEALKQKDSLALKLAIHMKNSGAAIEDIIKETGLGADEIIEL